MEWFPGLNASTSVSVLNRPHASQTFMHHFLGSESNMRLLMISIDKHPTFIGHINECCTISTIKQIFISTFCLNGFTMIGNDLRLLYEAEDLSDQTGLLAIKILYKID